MPSTDPSHASRTTALVVVERERGVIAVTGSDRVSWLNGVVTCDVAAVVAGTGAFGLLLSKQGKIQTDFYLSSEPERLLLATAPDTAAAAVSELGKMLVMEDAELFDLSGELASIALHGPKAVDLAALAAKLEGASFAALDRTGLGGAVLFVPRASVDDAVRTLVAKGAVLATGDAWPSVRIERGVGQFGVDYGPSDNPHEAALDRRAIAWQKGCYLGQEAVFMQDARGRVKRRLALLRVAARERVEPGAGVSRESGETTGEVTSSAWSERAGALLLLARVAAPDFQAGTRLVVAGAQAEVQSGVF